MPFFYHILSFATLALLALSSFPAHANALAAGHVQAARHIHGHDAVAKRRRDASSSGTCIPRPSTPLSSSTPTPTPSTTALSTTASSAPAPSPSAPHGKMCLDWADDEKYLSNFIRPKVGFFNNWSPIVPTALLQSAGIEPLLLLWGHEQVSEFQKYAVEGYARFAGGPNEPDQVSQANMSPADAADLFLTHLTPLKDAGYTLYGPCCTDSPDAKTWYLEFASNCTARGGCKIDIACTHLYNTDTEYMFTYLRWLHDTFGLPVLVTEVGDQDFSGANQQPTDLGEVMTFAEQLVNFTYMNDWMVAMCPYAVMDNINIDPLNTLIDANGYPSPLGYTYFG